VETIMTDAPDNHGDWFVTTRPARQLARVARKFRCEVVVDGLSVEGKTVDLNERGVAVVLPHPLFANLDSATVILANPGGTPVRMTGRVIRQRQIGVGQVLVGIQLAELSVGTTTALIEACAPVSPLQRETAPIHYPAPTSLLGWLRVLAGYPAEPFQDRRRIPRLPIHTACAILSDEKANRRGLTQDVSYTGLSAWFPDLPLDRLWSTVLQVKFVKLKAMPVGIVHRGSNTLVRFRVEHILEGEERWRDVHYSYWQHLS
jgi:hypothetical protein